MSVFYYHKFIPIFCIWLVLDKSLGQNRLDTLLYDVLCAENGTLCTTNF